MINARAFLVGPARREGTLAGQPVVVLFNAPAQVSDIGGPGAVARERTAWLPSDDVPQAWLNAELTVPDGTFRVTQHVPDGLGGSLLYLDK